MIKVGRNELCSCGSGKKYKKCCSDKITSADFAYQKLRRLEGVMVDNHLLPYVTKSLPQEVMAVALTKFFTEALPEVVDKTLLLTNFFMLWFLFNWVYEDFEEPIALRYAKEFKHQLDNEH